MESTVHTKKRILHRSFSMTRLEILVTHRSPQNTITTRSRWMFPAIISRLLNCEAFAMCDCFWQLFVRTWRTHNHETMFTRSAQSRRSACGVLVGHPLRTPQKMPRRLPHAYCNHTRQCIALPRTRHRRRAPCYLRQDLRRHRHR